jgi:uncharacterized protein Yka (UPF0111/DUF47 family)|tara:strand:+ start:816 stop:1070 length:255 start_codon:yes stop_codon:yes gene_type:complete
MLRKAYKKYKDKFGNQAQIIKAIEELAELQMALAKFMNRQGDVDNIIEEIADVEIMTAQLKMMFDCESQVKEWEVYKIEKMLNK